MITPLKPEDVSANKATVIPEFVIEAVNYMITKHWDGKSASFRQDDLIDKIRSLWPDGTPPTDGKTLQQKEISKRTRHAKIMEEHWLDFEPLYESVGWNVEYDKPAYNETYASTFEFTPAKGKR